MKEKTKKQLLEVATAVFITGDTTMIVVWLMFILGFVFGALIF